MYIAIAPSISNSGCRSLSESANQELQDAYNIFVQSRFLEVHLITTWRVSSFIKYFLLAICLAMLIISFP